MSNGKQSNLSVEDVSSIQTKKVIKNNNQKKDKTTSSPEPWHIFANTASEDDIKKRFCKEAKDIISKHADGLSNYCVLTLLVPEGSIGTWDLDRIFNALSKANADKDKDVLLMLLSSGGSIEPAYQISKLCKAYSKNKFIVSVPRCAKSAATLIAIGADEIHLGPLGQLGPIDPQLGGLPALGVTQALESIASLSERFPGSSEMFARYLRLALTVEQIGYCERISVSAAQYAERLLLTKNSLAKKANKKKFNLKCFLINFLFLSYLQFNYCLSLLFLLS